MGDKVGSIKEEEKFQIKHIASSVIFGDIKENDFSVLINLMGGILSQCVCLSNCHDVHFKYLLRLICRLYLSEKDPDAGKV